MVMCLSYVAVAVARQRLPNQRLAGAAFPPETTVGCVSDNRRAPPEGDQASRMAFGVSTSDPIHRDANVHRRASGCESKLQVEI